MGVQCWAKVTFHEAVNGIGKQILGVFIMGVCGTPLWVLAGVATGHTDELRKWLWWYPLAVAGVMIWCMLTWVWLNHELLLRTLRQRRRRKELQASEFRD